MFVRQFEGCEHRGLSASRPGTSTIFATQQLSSTLSDMGNWAQCSGRTQTWRLTASKRLCRDDYMNKFVNLNRSHKNKKDEEQHFRAEGGGDPLIIGNWGWWTHNSSSFTQVDEWRKGARGEITVLWRRGTDEQAGLPLSKPLFYFANYRGLGLRLNLSCRQEHRTSCSIFLYRLALEEWQTWTSFLKPSILKCYVFFSSFFVLVRFQLWTSLITHKNVRSVKRWNLKTCIPS